MTLGVGLHVWNPVVKPRRQAAHTWRCLKFMIFIIIKCGTLTQTSLCYLCQKRVPRKQCLPELKYCSQSNNLYKKVQIYKTVCTVHIAFLSDLKYFIFYFYRQSEERSCFKRNKTSMTTPLQCNPTLCLPQNNATGTRLFLQPHIPLYSSSKIFHTLSSRNWITASM